MRRRSKAKLKKPKFFGILYLDKNDIKKLQNGDSVVVSRGRRTNWFDVQVGNYIGIKEQGACYRKTPICVAKVIAVEKPLFGDVSIKIEIFSMDKKNQPRQIGLI